ncbi:hypothetical protein [Nannocystis exedens]|uniref:hypothetical protein n=1 Tax=Nannocystis exedens TaxID=54 RepID=UPI000BBA0270|nr:hypothetical protein [Nannocystis exedens]PCC66483.1 hypothetical protein NAEX_09071 [Nannocystis exedens]
MHIAENYSGVFAPVALRRMPADNRGARDGAFENAVSNLANFVADHLFDAEDDVQLEEQLEALLDEEKYYDLIDAVRESFRREVDPVEAAQASQSVDAPPGLLRLFRHRKELMDLVAHCWRQAQLINAAHWALIAAVQGVEVDDDFRGVLTRWTAPPKKLSECLSEDVPAFFKQMHVDLRLSDASLWAIIAALPHQADDWILEELLRTLDRTQTRYLSNLSKPEAFPPSARANSQRRVATLPHWLAAAEAQGAAVYPPLPEGSDD